MCLAGEKKGKSKKKLDLGKNPMDPNGPKFPVRGRFRCRAIENTIYTVEKPLHLWNVPIKHGNPLCKTEFGDKRSQLPIFIYFYPVTETNFYTFAHQGCVL